MGIRFSSRSLPNPQLARDYGRGLRLWAKVCAALAFAFALSASTRHDARAEPATPPAEPPAWCAPELETLSEGVCFSDPGTDPRSPPGPRTLVLFLHTLVGAGSSWQWEQQRVIARATRLHHAYAIMPRGRRGLGPGRKKNVWAWPTSPRTQEGVEDELVKEWAEARTLVEQRLGAPFERVLVFGFSNGAYYASTLALRARLEVDGYGVFAGGIGGKYSEIVGSKAKRRVPVFVGYGSRDGSQKDMQSLVRSLKRLGWRHRAKVEPIGHTVSDSLLASAFRFLSPEPTERKENARQDKPSEPAGNSASSSITESAAAVVPSP